MSELKLVDRSLLKQFMARDMNLFMRILDQILTQDQISLLEAELTASSTERIYKKLLQVEAEISKIGLPEVEEAYKTAVDEFAIKSGLKEAPPIKEEEPTIEEPIGDTKV